MKLLKDILYKVSLKAVAGNLELQVKDIQFDSRKVNIGSVFVAVKGTQVDGHNYISKAEALGAQAIVCEVFPEEKKESITYIEVADSSQALAIMAGNYYDNPSTKLKLVGITGTNGKTTSVTLLYRLFKEMGCRVGMLSTVVNMVNDTEVKATHTTSDPLAINQMIVQMVKEKCTHCFMEVSSHAIHQNRVFGLDFDGVAFTNITHDHLDYHKTFDNYIAAKKKVFDDLGSNAFALVNADDKRGGVMLQNTKATKYTFALKSYADFKSALISNTIQGLELDINGKLAWFKLVGFFNAYNITCAFAIATLLEEDDEQVLVSLSEINPPAGRFETVRSKDGIIGIVDYAHTPDALQNVLATISELRYEAKHVLTVVGCGGDRDKAKRPEMAAIATKMSDKVVLTSDNPRTEDPNVILDEMEQGVSITNKKKVLRIADRREAIRTSCMLAEPGDIILIAGKGHEDYQEVNGERSHFSDKEELLIALETLNK